MVAFRTEGPPRTLDIFVAGASPVSLAVASGLSGVLEGCRQGRAARLQVLRHVYTKVAKGLAMNSRAAIGTGVSHEV